LGADFPRVVLFAGLGAGVAASGLRLGGSLKLTTKRWARDGTDGSTMSLVTVFAIGLGTVGLVVDRACQVPLSTILESLSRMASQVLFGIADGRMWALGQPATHSAVTWYRRHMGRSILRE
jgi:hypothetical protein